MVHGAKDDPGKVVRALMLHMCSQPPSFHQIVCSSVTIPQLKLLIPYYASSLAIAEAIQPTSTLSAWARQSGVPATPLPSSESSLTRLLVDVGQSWLLIIQAINHHAIAKAMELNHLVNPTQKISASDFCPLTVLSNDTMFSVLLLCNHRFAANRSCIHAVECITISACALIY